MEEQTDNFELLDFIDRPGFCVRDDVILQVNPAAECLMITPGGKIRERLITGKQEYEELSDGCLYLTLKVEDRPYGASVVKMKDYDLFILEDEQDQAELKIMALAARELRLPLAGIMTMTDQLFPRIADQEDEAAQTQMAMINRALFQMMRIIGNMSDASRYAKETGSNQTTQDICAVVDEIFQKAGTLISDAGLTFSFINHPAPVYCLLDPAKLERAIYNLLSNAIKFTPRGGSIRASLIKRGSRMYLTIQDSGCGVPESLRGNVYSRYLRQPGLEDNRFGIGLGMVLVRSTAAAHCGTVLAEYPPEGGLRITMTIALRQNSSNLLRSNVLQVDYAGDRDHGLIELSESLPAHLYGSDRIN